MIPTPLHDLQRPIELLEEDDATEFVGKRHVRETNRFLRSLLHGVIHPLRTADHEFRRLTPVEKLLEKFRKFLRRHRRAKLIE